MAPDGAKFGDVPDPDPIGGVGMDIIATAERQPESRTTFLD